MKRALLTTSLLATLCCGGSTNAESTITATGAAPEPGRTVAPEPPPSELVVAIVGTNDVHGRVRSLPLLGGYVNVLRQRLQGRVVLLDGGDVFQGTLESNLNEGRVMVAAYNALGYDAVAVGNHEFDYGPAGPRAVPRDPTDEPRGALLARVSEAHFPFLSANLIVASNSERYEPDHFPGTKMVSVGALRIGVIGLTTSDTPHATHPRNFVGLSIANLAETAQRSATDLRAQGAHAIVLTAHAGGKCDVTDEVTTEEHCEGDEEMMQMLHAIPDGTIDAVVAGHTHKGLAVMVGSTAVIESFSYGVAFGRVDLVFDSATLRLTTKRLHAPHQLCERGTIAAECVPGSYEGAAVVPDLAVQAIVDQSIAAAQSERERPLGVSCDREFPTSADESALGNLLADLFRRVPPSPRTRTAEIVLLNNGGIRTAFPAGPLTYGSLYDTFPFDNRLVFLSLRGAEIKRIIERSLSPEAHGAMSVSGMRVDATDRANVRLTLANGRPVSATRLYRVATSDFLATSDDVMRQATAAPGREAVDPENLPVMRDLLATLLSEHGPELRYEDYAAPPRYVFAQPD